MKSFKSFYIKPLQAAKDLPINIEDYHSFNIGEDMDDILPEAKEKLVNNLLRIISNSPNAIVIAGHGENKFVATNINAARRPNQRFSFPEPNPIHLYLSVSVQHLEISTQIKKEIVSGNSIDEKHFEKFCRFSENTIAGIIFLVMALEAFMNYLMDEQEIYNIEGSNMTKEKIEWLDFGRKLNKAMPIISGVDFKSLFPKEHGWINSLGDFRNDLVHLKKNNSKNFTFYQDIYKKLLDFKSLENYHAALLYMNTLHPEFVTVKEE